MAQCVLKPKDWVIFREHPVDKLFGRKGHGFIWRIGRIVRVVDDEYVEVILCAPEPPKERKWRDPEQEPWNITGLALPEFPPEYLSCIHLRNRPSIVWLTESKPRRVMRKDVVIANSIADAEAVLAQEGGSH